MLAFLLKRPIAIWVIYIVLFIFSLLAFWKLPISLLPAIDVPRIIVKVNAPNQSPSEIEHTILRPMRENLLTLSYVKDLQSQASNETGRIVLDFDYKANMKLAYIEVNEKIDRLMNRLPRELERPQVIRVNTLDIPILRLQVIPKNEGDWATISDLSEKVLKKRLEAQQGVSFVDINGSSKSTILIIPNRVKMNALQISESMLIEGIQENNKNLRAVSVKDGQYQYYVQLNAKLKQVEDFKSIGLTTSNGQVIQLGQIAIVKHSLTSPQGLHLFNQKIGVVITLHKQAQARITELIPRLYQIVDQFKQDYPQIDFQVTQDQTKLLQIGIQSLKESLLWGGIFAFGILFFFMGDFRNSIIIGISLPSTLLLSFLFFYSLDISINIISLSGLTLGLGLLVDNTIVVLDSISRQRKKGNSLMSSCVQGTLEVIPPLISSVLTTLSVFLPLLFMSGLAGALFYDQAVSVAIILCISLLSSFTFLPLVYKQFFRGTSKPKADHQIFQWMLRLYKTGFEVVFKYKTISIVIFALLIPLPYFSLYWLKVEILPPLEKNETLIKIDWNEALNVSESQKRVLKLLEYFEAQYQVSEVDLGLNQFLLRQEADALSKVEIYLEFPSQKLRNQTEVMIQTYFKENYPQSYLEIVSAPNAFDQLFKFKQPYLAILWRNNQTYKPISIEKLDSITDLFPKRSLEKGLGSLGETIISLAIDHQKLSFYKISYPDIIKQLELLIGNIKIGELQNFGETIPIQIPSSQQTFINILQKAQISNREGQKYPLSYFITYKYEQQNKHLTADKRGIYHSFIMNSFANPADYEGEMKRIAEVHQVQADLVGQYFDNWIAIKELSVILIVAIGLLYFILVAQFESFLQPLIVLSSIPSGI